MCFRSVELTQPSLFSSPLPSTGVHPLSSPTQKQSVILFIVADSHRSILSLFTILSLMNSIYTERDLLPTSSNMAAQSAVF